MSEKTPPNLPMIGTHPIADEGACSTQNYVSLEEKTVLAAMRKLRERAVELRAAIDTSNSTAEKRGLESELAELRKQRAELDVQRDHAFTRKMIMLGHLPPEADPGYR
jgi:hypothetical protein